MQIIQVNESGDHIRESLTQRVEILKDWLTRQLEVAEGDKIAYSLANGPTHLCLFLAIVSAGGTACPMNPRYTGPELVQYMNDLNPKYHIIATQSVPTDNELECYIVAEARKALELRNSGHMIVAIEKLADCEPEDCESIADKIQREKRFSDAFYKGTPYGQVGNGHFSMWKHGPAPDVAPPVLMLHTGGTTGRPKVVPISKKSLLCSLLAISGGYQFVSSDVTMVVMPLFHVHGLLCSLSSLLIGHSTLVFPYRGVFSGSNFYRDARKASITWFTAVPSIHEILDRQAVETGCLPRLRFIRGCSSALSVDLLRRVKARYPGVPVVQAYGMTEACHQISSQSLNRAHQFDHSVGYPNRGIEVKILDANWEEVPPSVEGRICLKGNQVTAGYLALDPACDPNLTAFDKTSGFFDTGDMGFMTQEKEIVISGRVKEMVNRGGEKINPAEVETAIKALDQRVVQCVVFSGDHSVLGEVPHCCVIWDGPETEAEVAERVTSGLHGSLASFKIPERVFLTKEIQLSPVGKLQRMLVKKQFADRG